MNETKGFIKLYRSVLDWEWYNDINTFRLFLYCLLKANYITTKWRGIDIDRGTFITSYQKLANATGLTVQQVRTSFYKLEVTGEITHKSHNKYSVVVINNYEHYQDINTQNNKQTTNKTTSKQQTNNKQITTDKELKKEINKEVLKPLGEMLTTTIIDYTTNLDLQKSLHEFVEFRKTTKSPMTLLAFTKSLNKLNKLYATDDAKKIEAIDQSIENGWKGIFAVNGKADNKASYTWQGELKAEQEVADNKVYAPKRTAEEIKEMMDKL